MNRLLKSFFGLFLGVAFSLGVAASLNANNNAKIEETEAASQTITDSTLEIRFTRPSEWGNNAIKIHTWNEGGAGTTWPGYLMTWLWNNEYNEGVFSWSPSASEPLYGKIIFNNNNNGKQTGNLDAPSTSKWYYSNGWHDTGSMDIFLYDYDNKFNGTVNVHAWRDNGSGGSVWDADTWPGNLASQMAEATNGRVYKFTMNNRYDRVIFSSNGANQTGDLTPTGNYCYVLANDETKLDGKGTWWDNINYVHAHNFAMNTMMFRSISTSDQSSTAYCASRYAAAKSHMEAITSSTLGEYIIPEIESGFADAMPRLAAWAKANGKTFNTTTHTFSAPHSFSLLSVGDNNTVIIVVAISALGILSIGAYFFFKKSKKAEE